MGSSGIKMTWALQLRGTLRGHNGWVTQITTNPKYPDMILSSSRDKSLIVWKLNRDEAGNYGVPQKRLHGRGLLRRQQADRVCQQGQDHQAVEHPRPVQV